MKTKAEFYKDRLNRARDILSAIQAKGNPSPFLLEKLFSRVEYYRKKLDHESPFILADNPEAVTLLKIKVEGARLLALYFRQVNRHYKETRSLEGLRITPHWKAIALENITKTGKPFAKNDFYKLRRKVKFSLDRLKALERAKTFSPFSVNGIRVDLKDNKIIVSFPDKPSPETLEKLKKSPLRLKFSRYRQAWVRKFTGQGAEFFRLLAETLALERGAKMNEKT